MLIMVETLNFTGFQPLEAEFLNKIDGGSISSKSLRLGIVLTLLSPVTGVGYWFGYFVNS
jgi:hypothetical protein